MSMISEFVEDLRYLERCERETGDTSHYAQWFKSAADTIEELSAKLSASQMARSSQYYHGGWIPCEERMPECQKGEETDALMYQMKSTGTIHTGYYGTGGKYRDKYFRNYWDTKEGFDAQDVIAWRPLPEPYREVQDETD